MAFRFRLRKATPVVSRSQWVAGLFKLNEMVARARCIPEADPRRQSHWAAIRGYATLLEHYAPSPDHVDEVCDVMCKPRPRGRSR